MERNVRKINQSPLVLFSFQKILEVSKALKQTKKKKNFNQILLHMEKKSASGDQFKTITNIPRWLYKFTIKADGKSLQMPQNVIMGPAESA